MGEKVKEQDEYNCRKSEYEGILCGGKMASEVRWGGFFGGGGG